VRGGTAPRHRPRHPSRPSYQPHRDEGKARRTRADAAHRAAELDAHPERRLHEGLDLLADTWLRDTGGFVHDGQLAQAWLRRAVTLIHAREPLAAFVSYLRTVIPRLIRGIAPIAATLRA
jgi:hypothetical protein